MTTTASAPRPASATGPRPVAARTDRFTESVIREMTRLIQLHYPTDGINLAQGFPDFPAPRALKDAAIAAICSSALVPACCPDAAGTAPVARVPEALRGRVHFAPFVSDLELVTLYRNAEAALEKQLVTLSKYIDRNAPPPDLRAAFKASLARYKHPAAIEVLPALPRTALGKVQKHLLRKLATTPAAADAQPRR